MERLLLDLARGASRNGDVLLHGEDGQQLYYTKQGDGSFVGASGLTLDLSRPSRAATSSSAQDQVAYSFNAAGRLLSIKDRNNQGVTLAYDGSNRLADDHGRCGQAGDGHATTPRTS